LPEPPFTSNHPNIFSDQQEQWLGDAQAREQEPDYILLPEKDSEELTRIGQKLLAQLPPTSIHYHFRVYESEEANAFSSPGGYVYVSRKLITDARSEDEIAGVLAHEIGHIYTHQEAIEFTHRFKVRMNVNSFASEEDLDDKLQQLLNIHVKTYDGPSDDQLDKDEFVADRVGMYAMTRAGYAPRAFAECLDRISANKGRLGSFLTDMLDINSIETRRIRAARSLANELSGECKRRVAGASPEFKEFQQKILSAPVNWLVEATPGLSSFKLDPPLRAALDRVRFSPNGQYVLAQDESRIHVLSRAPLKRLFSIDAPGAKEAHFSPDSTQVVFHYPTMRVERWDVATGKREKFFELVDYDGCPQTSLSPDGKTMVCLSQTRGGVWLKLMDVESGKLFYDNKNFYQADLEVQPWTAIFRYITAAEVGTVVYSQDGFTMLIATGTKTMAYDLRARKPIGLHGDLSSIVQGRIAFADSNKLIFECDLRAKGYKSQETSKVCEASFPEGNLIHDFTVGYQWLDSVAHGNHVLIGPFRDSASALVDPSTGKVSAGFKMDALDLYDQAIASETAAGGVTVGDLGSQKTESVDLPISPMPELEAAAFSPDGRFLAFSNSSRSVIWDLDAQKQVALMRPFNAVRFDDQEQMYAQYPESHLKPGQNSRIDLKTGKVTEGAKYDPNALQYGNVLVKIRSMDKFEVVTENTAMESFDPATGALLWSKRFPHQMPILRHSDDGALLLISDLSWKTADDETARARDKFIRASDKKGEWLLYGLLVEELDSQTGSIQRAIALPQAGFESEPRETRSAVLYGDYLVVRGRFNNSTIYRLSDGKRLGAFYGTAIAGDGKLGVIAATNLDQEITLYDANTAKELKRVTVDHLPRAARIVAAKNALLVLTASQRVYTIDLPAIPGK
jgi:WD40 repeat protein